MCFAKTFGEPLPHLGKPKAAKPAASGGDQFITGFPDLGRNIMTATAEPQYDLDRASRAGGWEGNLFETGRQVAQILYRVTMEYVEKGTPLVPSVLLEDVAARVAEELYEPGALENGLWLATMHNALADMYRDFRVQVAEAKGLGL